MQRNTVQLSNDIQADSLPFMIHVEELAHELIHRVLRLEFHVHGQEEGGEE